MQAIRTKYICPTNTKGARISASAAAGRIIVEWDHALDVEENHKVAASIFCTKFNWSGHLVSGCLADGSFAHCFADRA